MNDHDNFDELCDHLFHGDDAFWDSEAPSDTRRESRGREVADATASLPSADGHHTSATTLMTKPAQRAKAKPPRDSHQEKPWLRLLGVASLFIGLFFGYFLLPKDAPTAGVAQKAIRDLRVGDKVLGDNPNCEEVENAPNVASANWRHGKFTLSKPSGDEIQIELLRPTDWFGDAKPNDFVYLNLAELGAEGRAELTYLGPCPPIKPGKGNVVIGTFKHHSAETVNLHIEGATEPIGTTVNHPFWSEDKQDFVRVDELVTGERVRTRSGIAQVASITRRGPPEPVYNIEVHREHVYRVGELGTLVHNKGKRIGLGLSATLEDLYKQRGALPYDEWHKHRITNRAMNQIDDADAYIQELKTAYRNADEIWISLDGFSFQRMADEAIGKALDLNNNTTSKELEILLKEMPALLDAGKSVVFVKNGKVVDLLEVAALSDFTHLDSVKAFFDLTRPLYQ